jgi:hypothetical protein
MALAPAQNDTEGQAALKSGVYNSGASAPTTNPMVTRVSIRLAAYFGLTAFETGRINNIAQKLLDDAAGDSSKVKLDAARPALEKMFGAL